MKVHHLNCATMCPFNEALTTRGGAWTARGRMVCHCLLIETPRGLALVDTGLGLGDLAAPKQRIGRAMLVLGAPSLDPHECAVRQVEALGYRADDVRDIVLTHLDFDHAGGIGDFPAARIHVHAKEFDAAMARASVGERERYQPAHWAHGPTWVKHREGGDTWKGFDAVQPLSEALPDVAMLPLHGHTRGHAAVAVRADDGWLLHAGDAYFWHDEISTSPWCPRGLAWFQSAVAIDDGARRRNQQRLAALAASASDVTLFCAHDANEYDRLRARSRGC